MIINHKYKYIFVGIPFSASSAISKYLINHYEGEFIYSKHTNIPTLISESKIDIDKYFVFGVYRSPIEILKSRYNKLRNNPQNRFSDKKFLRENGGFMRKKTQNLSKTIRENNMSFMDYLYLKFKYIPYNNEFTLNAPFLNYIIDFNDLENGLEFVLCNLGFKNYVKLKQLNKTNKRKDIDYSVPNSFHSKFFAPFIYHNSKYIPSYTKPKLNLFFYFIFLITIPVRKFQILKRDSLRSMKFDKFFNDNKN